MTLLAKLLGLVVSFFGSVVSISICQPPEAIMSLEVEDYLTFVESNTGAAAPGKLKLFKYKGELVTIDENNVQLPVRTNFVYRNGIKATVDGDKIVLDVNVGAGLAIEDGTGKLIVPGGAITANMLDNIPGMTFIGNPTADAGRPQVLTVAQVKSMLGL